MKDISLYTNSIVKSCNLKLEKSALKTLNKYVENMVFNIVSICAIIAFINNSKTITSKNVQIVYGYIKSTCKITNKEQKGGDPVLPSEYYGIQSASYSPVNNNADILQVDFNNGIARPAITGGGSDEKKEKTKVVYICIQDILKYYSLTASKEVVLKMIIIVDKYINCLLTSLKKYKKTITTTNINSLIKSNTTYDIFK